MSKFCIDCAHHSKKLFENFVDCHHSSQGSTNPVTGVTWYPTAASARGSKDDCLMFERKPTLWQRLKARVCWWTWQDFNREHLK